MARDLEGKVFLITGGTEGIGKAAAMDFAERGASLVIVGRNKDKTEKVATELRAVSGGAPVETLIGDLSSIAETRAVARAFKANHDRLDVLVNNAGAVFFTHAKSADDFEMTFALNHLAYFVLTNEVLDLLKKTPGSRVVSTSSGAHRTGRIDFDLIAKRNGNGAGFSAYADSKLANILFTRELAKRLEGSGVAVSCFHPGFVETGFGKNNQGFMGSLIGFGASLFARTPSKGAETLIWLATSPDAASPGGEYFMDKRVRRTARLGGDRELASRLWNFTEKLCADQRGSSPAN